MAATGSGISPPRSPHRQLPRRQSWSALLVAGVAIVSFVVFEAMDLDGLTLGLVASAPASAFGPNISDSEADRWHAHTHESLVPIVVSTAQRAVPAPGAPSPRRRVQAVRPSHLPAPHTPSADPL